MKKAILIFLLTYPLCTFAQTSVSTCTDSLLNELDRAIAESDTYVQQRKQRIDNLKQMLRTPQITAEQSYDINTRLFYEYKPFMLDSAIHYTRLNVELAREMASQERYYESTLNLALLYSITASFVEAADLLQEIPVKALSSGQRIHYYETYRCFYNYYRHDSQAYAEHYTALCDSLLQLYPPESNGHRMIYSERLVAEGRYDEARRLLTGMLDKASADDAWKAIVAYQTGASYVQEEIYEKQIVYFAMSAIADVKNSIKENMALRSLALALYHTGDIDRAYTYIRKSMEDAIFCNAQLRTMEVSPLFPIIEEARQTQNQQQRRNLHILNISILLLALFLLITIVYIYLQMKRLSRTRKSMAVLNNELKKANNTMHDINRKLVESNVLKDEYIARYLNEASQYLNKLEEYRRNLNRIAASGKVDELYKALKSNRLMEEELHNFYANFDRSFLQLFPHFVDSINALLHEKDRIILQQHERLNTELRIFALIRLGINDSTMIAHILRYPVRTIYNYRARMRNKAIGERLELENEVMKIGVITSRYQAQQPSDTAS